MPLAFGAHAGSLLALTGTPVNVIVSEAAADAGGGRASASSSSRSSASRCVVGTIAIVVLFGERLLPNRTPRARSRRDFSRHARTLVEQYGLDHDRGRRC